MEKRNLVGLVVVVISVAACAASTDPEGNQQDSEMEPVAQMESALSSDFTDSSGTVTVRIKQCGWIGPGQILSADCSVESDFVLVGGGAEIEGLGNPGALLTASYPDGNLTTWHARSKDHHYIYNHKLRSYAIGLKLSGLSSTQLRSRIYYTWDTSGYSAHPSITAELPPGYTLLGGGAYADYGTGQGLLLTDSRPDGIQWVAQAKDHIYSSPGTVTAYAIGISSGYISGFNGYVDAVTHSASSWSGTGYNSKSYQVPTGRVLSSIGGAAMYSGGKGRLLTDMIPFADSQYTKPGALVWTKDHYYADSGYTYAYIVSIKKR